MAAPERTCVACRGKGGKSGLIRLALSPAGAVVIDYGGKLPGRGAYVCAERPCLEKITQKGVLSRAFKGAVEPPAKDDFFEAVRFNITRKIVSLLGMARKSGAAAMGFDAAATASLKYPEGTFVIAADAAENTIEKLKEKNRAAAEGAPRFSTKEGLGEALGTSPVGIVYVHGGALAGALRREIGRLVKLAGG